MSILKIKNGTTWEEIPAGGVGVPSGGTAGQILMKSSAADYADEWHTLAPDDIGAMSQWELLWQNASPYTQFAAQTLPIDLSYNYYFIAMVESLEGGTPRISCAILSRESASSSTPSSLFTWSHDNQPLHRHYYFTSGGIYFDRSYYGLAANNGNNYYCIPYKIYGIKGVG